MSQTSLQYLLPDLPSDHEIEGGVATERDVIQAMLANHDLDGVTKRVRIAKTATFRKVSPRPYNPRIVHVAGHATDEGLWMLGQVLNWAGVATALAR